MKPRSPRERIETHHRRWGTMPPPEFLATVCQITLEQARQELADFQAPRLDFVSPEPAPAPAPALAEPPAPVQSPDRKKSQVRWLGRALAALSLTWSIFYTHDFISRFDPSFLSWVGAGILTGAGFVSMSVMMLALRDKKTALAILGGFVASLTLALLVFCSYQGVYQKRSEVITKSGVEGATMAKASLKGEASRIEAAIKTDQGIIDSLVPLRAASPIGSAEYNRASGTIGSALDRIRAGEGRLSQIQAELKALPAVGRADIFSALAQNLGGNPEDWELKTAMLFSVVIDLVGALAVAVSVFL